MKFKPGCYHAKIDNPAKLQVDLKVNTDTILAVNIDTWDGEKHIEQAIKDVFCGQILEKQSVNIDGVSSASILTKGVKSVVGSALADAMVE
ncbi:MULTISPECIES: hypothetical protein [Lactobacillus]|uniref:FMN-binding domain-containing protein n=1 Tax=Lactobacillus xujianguonis TaxID=2495899 RepID=A0A437SW67_9LACO|nr:MULTISPECIES: hypothetical protein [Lactobacillus]RVU71181.1 hypothetical protein EJK17_02995 [Lactobacillus xujianguonis]RVU74138.1 hypothetical protein EJK20_04885 [Lactobacillus xujianguonis]